MDKAKVECFREQFRELDLLETGKLTRENVADILSNESEEIEKLMVTLLFEEYDKNNDGYIDIEEFATFCLAMNGLNEKDILKRIFDLCDLDKNGVLDIQEVKRLGALMGLDVSLNDALATVIALDQNNDQKIDFNEFCAVLSHS